ncbi:hypothetical protein, partial [Xanthobacter autotrophicus]|uniref:hypothetical protein n=1 Tax=Xanthobacter autotrophicus TaxID=280 RepID=UPI00372D63AC
MTDPTESVNYAKMPDTLQLKHERLLAVGAGEHHALRARVVELCESPREAHRPGGLAPPALLQPLKL